MKPCLYCLFAVLWSLPLSAEVYKITDEYGRTTYTDAPPAKDQKHEKVDLKPINSQPPVEPQRRSLFTPARDTADDEVNYALSLTVPADGTQVPPGQRDLRLAVQVSPGLQRGHNIQFAMNGEPLGQPGLNTSYMIEEIYRGEHTLSARVLNSQGTVLATSDAITVYVHRPTLNSPNR